MITETLVKERTYTIAEYFEIDKGSETKLEYHNGKIITMSGGTATHSRIAARIIAMLSNLLDDGPFEVYTSDIKIQISTYQKFIYPDAAVVSQQPEYYQNRKDVITNPLLIVEVLSPSTQKHDRTDKFMMYRTLPSLREYVLVEQDQPRVTTFFRNAANHWEDTDVMGLDSIARFQSVAGEISLARIYKNIEFE
ncbi:MAG: Uma2 family endonuclease [Tunicatimonas sp.]